MRPFYEIEQMIIAHYNNDDDTFNAYARAVIDYYKKDGNILGAEELEEIMTTGHLEPRANRPKLLQESTPIYPDEEVITTNTNVITEIKEEQETISDNNKTDTIDENIKPKRHRRTKAEMLLARQQEETSVNINDSPKTKRHRRTKAELEAIGYYDNKKKE